MIDRRKLMQAAIALPVVAATPAARTPLRMLLNSGPSGANAWFFLAEERGWFRDQGIDLAFSNGRGAYTAAPRMFGEGFDIAYGDINSLIEVAANTPGVTPSAIYMMFNASPCVIVVAADGPIRTARDLPGRRIAAHPTDVALATFPAYARATGIDPASITVAPSDASMRDLVVTMLAGESDGVFGYYTTQTAAAMTAGIDRSRLRFLRFDEQLPDFYGSAIMASAALIRDKPKLLSRLTSVFNRGVAATIADPGGAIDAVARRDPKIDKAIERVRLEGTLQREMAHPDGRRLGIGDVDDARLARSIATMVATKSLRRIPATREIFRREFLPPRRERMFKIKSR